MRQVPEQCCVNPVPCVVKPPGFLESATFPLGDLPVELLELIVNMTEAQSHVSCVPIIATVGRLRRVCRGCRSVGFWQIACDHPAEFLRVLIERARVAQLYASVLRAVSLPEMSQALCAASEKLAQSPGILAETFSAALSLGIRDAIAPLAVPLTCPDAFRKITREAFLTAIDRGHIDTLRALAAAVLAVASRALVTYTAALETAASDTAALETAAACASAMAMYSYFSNVPTKITGDYRYANMHEAISDCYKFTPDRSRSLTSSVIRCVLMWRDTKVFQKLVLVRSVRKLLKLPEYAHFIAYCNGALIVLLRAGVLDIKTVFYRFQRNREYHSLLWGLLPEYLRRPPDPAVLKFATTELDEKLSHREISLKNSAGASEYFPVRFLIALYMLSAPSQAQVDSLVARAIKLREYGGNDICAAFADSGLIVRRKYTLFKPTTYTPAGCWMLPALARLVRPAPDAYLPPISEVLRTPVSLAQTTALRTPARSLLHRSTGSVVDSKLAAELRTALAFLGVQFSPAYIDVCSMRTPRDNSDLHGAIGAVEAVSTHGAVSARIAVTAESASSPAFPRRKDSTCVGQCVLV